MSLHFLGFTTPEQDEALMKSIQSVPAGKLSVYDFGRELLRTNDLDPVYVLVWEAMKAGDLIPEEVRRWLLAYFCFYHVGTASWIAEGLNYWDRFETAAGSKDYPRCSERRHFRGAQALRSVAYLKSRGVGELFGPFDRGADREWTAAEVVEVVQQWVGFGPWIAFKAADMLERLSLLRIEFDLDTVMYDSPMEGARLLWELEGPKGVDGVNVGEWAVDRILTHLSVPGGTDPASAHITPHPVVGRASSGPADVFLAPPRYERPVGLQEVETILCKWKSYMGGRYHVGEDVASCRWSLLRFPACRTAQRLIWAGKAGGLWS
jgi:hypothetical protein